VNILDVIYKTAHDYPGGIPALAVRMGKSPNVLQNKVNPNCETHHTTAEEAAAIADLASSDEIAKAFAARRNLFCVRMVDRSGASDMEILDLILSMQKEMGDWAMAIQKGLADGVIDWADLEKIEKEFNEFCSAVLDLMSRLKSIVQDRRKTVRAK
jgi:hypothetical protein